MRWEDDRIRGYDDPDWCRTLDDGSVLVELTVEEREYQRRSVDAEAQIAWLRAA